MMNNELRNYIAEWHEEKARDSVCDRHYKELYSIQNAIRHIYGRTDKTLLTDEEKRDIENILKFNVEADVKDII